MAGEPTSEAVTKKVFSMVVAMCVAYAVAAYLLVG